MGRFTSRSPIFNATNIARIAAENVRKNDVFRTFSIATQSAVVASGVGGRERDLRMVLHIFRMHHFILTSMAENLRGWVFTRQKFVIYTVEYIFQHAFSTLTPLGPKYPHGTHTRQVLAVSSNSISQTISSPYSSKSQYVWCRRS